MSPEKTYAISVFPGDGIGPEVTEAALEVIRAVEETVGGFHLECTALEAGAEHFRQTGVALPPGALQAARAADAILLGAMGLPEVRYEDGTEISPQLDLREELALYAGLRPVRVVPGLPPVLSDPRAARTDFVLVRESTEGLFASRKLGARNGVDSATDVLKITRQTSEALFDHAFRLARSRKDAGYPGRVTCVDKANVLESFAFFREIFLECAERYPDIAADCAYVDATALGLVMQPWTYDVLVTENMFGDILSDVGAALMGGMGMAPSADIGDEHAVFQPCHGSAPDIIGQGKANPTATVLSAAMMLDWLGARFDNPSCSRAAQAIGHAVDAAYAGGNLLPTELGGDAGTADILAAITGAIFEQATDSRQSAAEAGA